MNAEDFQPRSIGIHVGNVQRVAVAEAGGVEPLAVAANATGAVDDVVAAVAIDVGDAEAVIALTAIVAIAGRAVVAVERPAPGQFAVAPVPGDEHGTRVVAAAHDEARPLAVEIRDAGQEAIDAVAVRVAPVADLAARRHVIGRGQRRAGRPSNTVRNSGPVEDVAARRCGSRPLASPITCPCRPRCRRRSCTRPRPGRRRRGRRRGTACSARPRGCSCRG